MMNSYKKLKLNYYIIFKIDKSQESYIPISDNLNIRENGQYHLFDDNLEKVLPAVWYCLHLPRYGLESKALPIETLANTNVNTHSIKLVPSCHISALIDKNIIHNEPPTLIIYEDSCKEDIKEFSNDLQSRIQPIAFSELNNTSLNINIQKLKRLMDIDELNSLDEAKYLGIDVILPDNSRNVLPLIFLMNQLDVREDLLQIINNPKLKQYVVLMQTINIHANINTLLELKNKNYTINPHDMELNYKKIIKEKRLRTKIPVVLTMPGISNYQWKLNKSSQQSIPNKELEVLKLISLHRAVSNNGFVLNLNNIPKELFERLDIIEKNCRGRVNCNFIWKSLRKLGEILIEYLGEEGTLAIARASHITLFSDFPIGLAILPGTSAPLACIQNISYHTITPLTRAFQLELASTHIHLINKEFKVVIAECLSVNEEIRPASDKSWNLLTDFLNTNKNIDVIYECTPSVVELKALLEDHKDADILILSCHGDYDKTRNMAGLKVGEEFWMAIEDDFKLPPIVLLSACYPNPRGSSVVAISDLLLRAGAKTVLGACIPVGVPKNALLMIRLFVYIIEAQNGRIPCRTLDEVWRFVVATNAVNEIVMMTDKLYGWAHTPAQNGKTPIEEFCNNLSVGKLRSTHCYQDTINILVKLAERDGMLKYLNPVVIGENYFPESIFYQLMGYPEKVIISSN